ncbi:IS21 family transposase [Gordonia sp. JH63]|uniref:IS21 family transposase n=2 Tax=Gordonia terrae TaxID=2055 RepID=A0AAD0K3C1_9ACTN|nr:Transposase-like protein [Gordonia sp. KTR9]ANY21520.1 transposase [Gordonia terrae]PZT90855.1 MAG: IS21 family transposase [Gordonia sp. (in: high G+C Gram-positive bacteria)]QHD84074.1 IS21 family transposase [Gordonia sp. JH63]SCC59792.1 Transposase [Gordonia sp. v-85]VTR08756.1 transposase [Clostridioides difficile]GAB44893.1 putative transposase [Gordonia terrae NBRC 100016]
MEQWAEIRRLHRSEGVPIREIARRLGVARNTVRAALASDTAPKYSRPATGSAVDAFEPQIRALLREYPTMPATVIAERVGWTRSLTVLKDRVRAIRPEFRGVDPADRVIYQPGGCSQWDLWFPDYRIPLSHNQFAMLPVLVMTLAFSRYRSAVMIPSRQGGDILTGMWLLLSQLGGVTRKLVWDREAAIGPKGTPTALAAGFVGTLGTRLELAPPRDPEYKGMVERNNRFFESSFLPGRQFSSPADFTAQFDRWLADHANTRVVRAIGDRRPCDVFAEDLEQMTGLPPTAPHIGLSSRVRLGRDYYVRVAGNDYSVHPSVIGRFVDITADLQQVRILCGEVTVADHARSWANHVTIADPQHVRAAKELRRDYRRQDLANRARNAARIRAHPDGHEVPIRALPDYDELFGVNFATPPQAHPPTTSTSIER